MIVLAEADGAMLARASSEEYRLSERIGSTPRYVDFPDGGRFETLDHAAVEAAFGTRGSFVHRLESRYRFVLIALVVLVVSSWLIVTWGIPALSKWAAFQLPANTYQEVGEYSLDYLDQHLFEPSELPADRQALLQAHFAPALREFTAAGMNLRVHFRQLGQANALALPSGDLVFSDEIVELAGNDDELLAVLAHEIGHVAGRHAVRRSFQAAILGLTVALISGDASGLSEVLTSVPIVLTQLGYSRDMEREADDFALAFMHTHSIPTHHFVDLMSRLNEDPDCTDKADCIDPDWLRYVSTHPDMTERLQRFNSAR